MKTCGRCQTSKEESEFTKNKNRRDGLSCYCRQCCAEYAKKYYRDNSEPIKEKCKAYRKINPLSKLTEFSEERKFYVYLHKLPGEDFPFYAGKGHGRRAWKNNRRSQYWKNIVKGQKIIVEIVEEGLTEKEAFELEAQIISRYGRRQFGGHLCNLSDGGEGSTGLVISDEARKKISESLRGNIPWNKGIPQTEETKKKLSEALKGRAGPWTGKKRPSPTAETRAKMSEAHKRRNSEKIKTSTESCSNKEITNA